MKVLQINALYGSKSTGTIVSDIDQLLQAEGHESYVAYTKAIGKLQHGYRVGNLMDYKIHGLLTRIMGKQAYFSTLSTKKLLKYIREVKPDIIHLHNLHNNYVNLNLLLKYIIKNKIKTVITLHDCWFFTGKCFHYESAKCYKWQSQCVDCPKLKDDVPSWFFDRVTEVYEDKKRYLNNIDDLVIVGVSEWISNEAKKSFLKSKEIVTIHNGVDLNIFKPIKSDMRMKLNISDKFVILGTADKWLNERNRDTFRYIFDQLSHDEILVLIGCSEEQLGKLPSNVMGLKYISERTELAKIYSMSDVFVNVTWEDSLPTVNIESICCGSPIITFDSGGSPEIINSETGIVVKQGDYISLLKAVREVKLKGKENYELNCVKLGINKYNKKDRYIDYINLYQNMIEKIKKVEE